MAYNKYYLLSCSIGAMNRRYMIIWFDLEQSLQKMRESIEQYLKEEDFDYLFPHSQAQVLTLLRVLKKTFQRIILICSKMQSLMFSQQLDQKVKPCLYSLIIFSQHWNVLMDWKKISKIKKEGFSHMPLCIFQKVQDLFNEIKSITRESDPKPNFYKDKTKQKKIQEEPMKQIDAQIEQIILDFLVDQICRRWRSKSGKERNKEEEGEQYEIFRSFVNKKSIDILIRIYSQTFKREQKRDIRETREIRKIRENEFIEEEGEDLSSEQDLEDEEGKRSRIDFATIEEENNETIKKYLHFQEIVSQSIKKNPKSATDILRSLLDICSRRFSKQEEGKAEMKFGQEKPIDVLKGFCFLFSREQLCYKLNTRMRNDDDLQFSSQLVAWITQGLHDILKLQGKDCGINILPKDLSDGYIYRGNVVKIPSPLKEENGKIHIWMDFKSCSIKEEVGRRFATESGHGELFKIKMNKNSRNHICFYSSHIVQEIYKPEEKQVLLLPYFCYKVLQKKKSKKCPVVTIEECLISEDTITEDSDQKGKREQIPFYSHQ